MESDCHKLEVLQVGSPMSSISIPWDLLDVTILGPNLRTTESETGGWSPTINVLARPPDDSEDAKQN